MCVLAVRRMCSFAGQMLSFSCLRCKFSKNVLKLFLFFAKVACSCCIRKKLLQTKKVAKKLPSTFCRSLVGLDIVEVWGLYCWYAVQSKEWKCMHHNSILAWRNFICYNLSSMWGTLIQGTCTWIYGLKCTLLHKRSSQWRLTDRCTHVDR